MHAYITGMKTLKKRKERRPTTPQNGFTMYTEVNVSVCVGGGQLKCELEDGVGSGRQASGNWETGAGRKQQFREKGGWEMGGTGVGDWRQLHSLCIGQTSNKSTNHSKN